MGIVTNKDRVQKMYECFGRGDIAPILEMLASDVEWEYDSSAAESVPWLAKRRGRAEVAKFFEALTGLTFHRFEPKAVLESGNLVVAVVDVDTTVNATGKTIPEEDEVHIWHFNPAGQVVRFRHRVDTALHLAACRA